MAEVHPFRGWRYDLGQVGDLSDVTAPPYDVISPAQQKDLYERHPCNVVRLILNREEPGDESPDLRYQRAAGFLKQWQGNGTLLHEREEALYVYHQEFTWDGKPYVRRGFLGRLRLEEFGQGHVFPHEQTLAGPKADRLALTKACRTNLSPVFGLYPDAGGHVQEPLEAAIRTLTGSIATDHLGVVHRLWAVKDHAVIAQVRAGMRDAPIFIADGHHRYETALNYRRWLQSEDQLEDPNAPANFVLMHFVGMSDPGLAILPTHRLVSGLPALTADDIRAILGTHFELEDMGHGSDGATEAWGMLDADGGQDVLGFGTPADGRWLFARVKDASPMAQLAPGHSAAWRSLGVSLLHKLALEHLIAARFPEATQTLRYVHLLDEVNEAVSGRSCQLACLVPPARIEHVEEIASHRETMPPKSTYFYPKLLSGLVFNPLS